MTESIRASRRETCKKLRKEVRFAKLNSARISTNKYETFDCKKIADKLKTKASVKQEELTLLKNWFSYAEENINSFVRVNGSLRGLTRELTGCNAAKQALAAACLCNLAAGNSKTAHVVAKHSKSYLITALSSYNTHLLTNCLWALGNIVSWENSSVIQMKNEGLLMKLLNILENYQHEDILEGVFYLLVHLCYSNNACLSIEDVKMLFNSILKLRSQCPDLDSIKFELLLLLSPQLTEDNTCLINSSFIKFMEQTIPHMTLNSKNDVESYYTDKRKSFLQFLANISSVSENSNLLLHFLIHNKLYIKFFIKCLNNVTLYNDTIWLLGNIYKFSDDSYEKEHFFNEIFNILTLSNNFLRLAD